MALLPDIQLGPGDTAPMTSVTLYQPDKADGSRGDPMPLLEDDGITPKVVTVRYQPRNGSAAAVSRAAIVAQTSLTVNVGRAKIDWLGSGGAVPPGDYNLRFIVVDAGGRQETWPNGPDVVRVDGSNEAFLWFQVSRDFLAIGP